jgi:hypothetical protein
MNSDDENQNFRDDVAESRQEREPGSPVRVGLKRGGPDMASSVSARLPTAKRLVSVAVMLGLAEIAAWTQGVMLLQMPRAADISDFRAYYVAAWIGMHTGWSRIYDTAEQVRVLHAIWPTATQVDYISPPTVVWLVAPLTVLSPHAAFALFAALAWAAMLAASQFAAPPGRWNRFAFALLVLGMLPAAATVVYGQVSGFVLLSVAASWRLLDTEHDGWAGVVLAGIAFKPHLAALVPVALLVAGRWRALGAFVAAAAVLGGVAVLLVGVPGLEQMVRLDASYSYDPSQRAWALSAMVGGGPVGLGVQALVVAAALAPALRRGGSAGPVLAAAVCGSLLANVYLHGVDLVLYMLPIWVALREPGVRLRVLAALLWLSLDVAIIYPWVTVLAAAAMLAGFAIPSRFAARLGLDRA